MSAEAPPTPSLGDAIVAALKDAPHPLKLGELVKKLPKPPKPPKGTKPLVLQDQVVAVLPEELRAGRLFSSPSGKNGEPRYWGRDEQNLIRERAVELAQKPVALSALVKSVAKEIKGADAGFVEGVLRDMIGAEALFAHPETKKGTMVGAHPAPPPLPPLDQGKNPAAVKKLLESCLKLATTAGVGLEDVLAALRRSAGVSDATEEVKEPVAPAGHPAAQSPEPIVPPSSPPEESGIDIEARIMAALDRYPVIALNKLREQMPPGSQGREFDEAVLRLDDKQQVVLSQDANRFQFSEAEQASYVRDGDALFTTITKRG